MRVRLVKKFAEMIDDIDLSTSQPGDVLDLKRSEARLLIAEGWAVPAVRTEQRHFMSSRPHSSAPPAIAAERHGRVLKRAKSE